MLAKNLKPGSSASRSAVDQEHQPSHPGRRSVLWQTAALAMGVALLPAASRADQDQVAAAVRSMESLTGAELPSPYAQSTIGLLEAILPGTQAMRDLDLGETEPATKFFAG
jgi:hypothetical protein